MCHFDSGTPRRICVALVLILLSGAIVSAIAGDLRLILGVSPPNADRLAAAVVNVGGHVTQKFLYLDALAVTIPVERMQDILAMPEITRIAKDVMESLPEPVSSTRPGMEGPEGSLTLQAEAEQQMTMSDLKAALSATPAAIPVTNALTKASDFWSTTSHYGENVVVALIDAGVSRTAIAVAGASGERIVGAENFTSDGVPADAAINRAHGTNVASCVGANAIFGVASTNALVRAFKKWAPETVLPNYFGPGIDGVIMLGQAPLVKFYALKVFPYNSGTTPRSVIVAAIERAIQLKELYNAGAGGANIRVANMSLGGRNFIAGDEPFYAPLVVRAHNAGIVLTVSAGNNGPAGMTIGTPGDSRNILTVGATDDAVHARIYGELVYSSFGGGLAFRPTNTHVVANFSSRGPTADGRVDPDIVAPGSYRFVQNANRSLAFVNGTSFSSPTVTGAAALLISAHPDATPDQIRGALLAGANPWLLNSSPQPMDQGYGFLDVMAAHEKFGAANPRDMGLATPYVRANIAPFGLDVKSAASMSVSTGWLSSGQRREYYLQSTEQPLKGLTVNATVTRELPPGQQNVIWGDLAFLAVQSAKTSAADYRRTAWTGTGATFTLGEQDMQYGLTRVVAMCDYAAAGRVKVNFQIAKNNNSLKLQPLANGFVTQDQVKVHTVTIPPGKSSLRLSLEWWHGWEAYPTSDIDLIVLDPAGNQVILNGDNDGDIDGISADVPERIIINSPMPGTWTLLVVGYYLLVPQESYCLRSDANMIGKIAAGDPTTSADVPREFGLMQNYPNPFNPMTTIRYALPVDAAVRLVVYNLLGEQVAVPLDAQMPAGLHAVGFDARELPSGVYLYRLAAMSTDGSQNFIDSKRFVVVK